MSGMMATMTLTEFLLARIAEDEAEAQDWPTDGRWGLHSPGQMWTDPHGRPIYAPRDRVLAECEAKRDIVGTREEMPAGQSPFEDGIAVGLQIALRLLAFPYADHPDYRDEWRP